MAHGQRLALPARGQALFWIFTYPANQATANWAQQPEDWELLRQQWDYSHAVGAVLQLLALAALVTTALRSGDNQASLSQ